MFLYKNPAACYAGVDLKSPDFSLMVYKKDNVLFVVAW